MLRVVALGYLSLQTGACRVVSRQTPNQEVKTILQPVCRRLQLKGMVGGGNTTSQAGRASPSKRVAWRARLLTLGCRVQGSPLRCGFRKIPPTHETHNIAQPCSRRRFKCVFQTFSEEHQKQQASTRQPSTEKKGEKKQQKEKWKK